MANLVKIQVRNPEYESRKRLAPGVPVNEFNIYAGQVAPYLPWMDRDVNFALTTGDPDWPVRVIEKKNVVRQWKSNHPLKDNVEIIDGKYVVTSVRSRKTCTCTSYKFRKTCSHVTR